MQVIFIKDLKGQGRKGETKEVSEGYAQNFLLKKGYAKPVTSQLIKSIKQEQETKINKEAKLHKQHILTINSLAGKSVKIFSKAGDTGKLFGGVHEKDILHALEKQYKLDVSGLQVSLPAAIKTVGEYNFDICFPGTEQVKLRVSVVAS